MGLPESSQAEPLIYLIEDNDDLRRVWHLLFGMKGYRVQAFDNGTDALEAIQDGEAPVILISDYFLPDINGVALIAKVREAVPALHCILISGNDAEDIEVNPEFVFFKKTSKICKDFKSCERLLALSTKISIIDQIRTPKGSDRKSLYVPVKPMDLVVTRGRISYIFYLRYSWGRRIADLEVIIHLGVRIVTMKHLVAYSPLLVVGTLASQAFGHHHHCAPPVHHHHHVAARPAHHVHYNPAPMIAMNALMLNSHRQPMGPSNYQGSQIVSSHQDFRNQIAQWVQDARGDFERLKVEDFIDELDDVIEDENLNRERYNDFLLSRHYTDIQMLGKNLQERLKAIRVKHENLDQDDLNFQSFSSYLHSESRHARKMERAFQKIDKKMRG